MIAPILNILTSKHIILASGSPRRKDILHGIGLNNVEIIPSTFEENLEPSMYSSLQDFVIETSFQKALEVSERLDKLGQSPDLIIAADTIVALDGKVYGKPGTAENSRDMLTKLQGKPHEVLTGVTLLWRGFAPSGSKSSPFLDQFCEMTLVHLAPLTEVIIDAYVQTKEPLDKAGGYGIQGIGGTLVERIEGDYYNVVGFPLHRFCTVVSHHVKLTN